ncbi:putative diphthamide synthesis protein-domain-containing protein [Lasiosphaeria miniovina]|uniref:2-(3-amino-3-carboxypropyl)histidine synthase subunit 2 n=1 Tax=Lasiosphaeria miniovina TaxID=1954250 RepID=A0AA40DTW1_9PEZI|nr:putative diphthamide synthesis protein-domain-containing protein [Lasiosphaeria miniovina]KAK0713167.1 putative diphthamide synthesis protein-domain-containing protein [Lasiosphaeria miniovina]
MANELSAPPILSTPAIYLVEHIDPAVLAAENEAQAQKRSDDELHSIYEIAQTAREVQHGRWKRIALQFPDSMLGDAPWVVQALTSELESLSEPASSVGTEGASGADGETQVPTQPARIYILADTSYSSCCVDEIAAEHINADVVVHYGRSCLSPTSRLPVIYVFTQHALDTDAALAEFEREFPDKDSKVVLVADVTYQDHAQGLAGGLHGRGYGALLSTAIVHDPMGQIPNRKITDWQGIELAEPLSSELDLKEYSVFHISSPPTALLLALSSRVKSLYILPTSAAASSAGTTNTQRLLSRRYGRLMSLATAGVIGILVNTLSISNYLASIDNIRKQIAAAGKKSYTLVVGKLNPAKLANFAEIDGWVVIGCWESSLVEDDAGFYRPVITPFELDVALANDETRVWTGEWWGGIEAVKPAPDQESEGPKPHGGGIEAQEDGGADKEAEEREDGGIDDEESEPPQFDLRTGKLISHSRPMRARTAGTEAARGGDSGEAPRTTDASFASALALRPKAELAMVNGVVSPGAEFLRSQRTWQGLGSDFSAEDSAVIEEGRSGVARGYTVGEDERRA